MRVHTQTDRVYIDAKADGMEDKTRALVAELNRMNTTLNEVVKAQAAAQPGSAGMAPAQALAPIIIQLPLYPAAPRR